MSVERVPAYTPQSKGDLIAGEAGTLSNISGSWNGVKLDPNTIVMEGTVYTAGFIQSNADTVCTEENPTPWCSANADGWAIYLMNTTLIISAGTLVTGSLHYTMEKDVVELGTIVQLTGTYADGVYDVHHVDDPDWNMQLQQSTG